MEGSYKTFLEMKTLFAEFPTSFYSKLSKPELDRFKLLMQAAESLKPKPLPKKHRPSLSFDSIYFQPKSIIFCLSIKKLFSKKTFSYIRYSFALIRCLFKEFQRVESKKLKFEMKKSKEPFFKDIGIGDGQIESELTEQNESKESENLKRIEKLLIKNKSYKQKRRILDQWRRFVQRIQKGKKMFVRKLKNIGKRAARTVLSSVFRFKNWKVLAGNMLVKALITPLRVRKNRIFLTVFFRGRFMRPSLSIISDEVFIKLNTKSKPLLEIQNNYSLCVNSEKNTKIEDFKYIERKNTKMTKKKKVLLGRAPPQLQKLEKNHSWVLAFALVKWKKLYMSTKSQSQTRPTALSLAFSLLSLFSSKYHKRLCSILFENLKVKYMISIQNKNFKTYLLFKMISGIITNKQNILVYRAFRSLFATHHKKVSFPPLSIDLQSFHSHEPRGEVLYKILKKILQNSILKKKVFSFISIQNFEPTSRIYFLRSGLSNLFLSMQKIIFFKKFVIFFEIKNKTFIIYKKIEFLTDSSQFAIENACSRALQFSVYMLKLNSLDRIHILLLEIAKVHRKEMIRIAFADIKEYADDMESFFYARNLFTGSLMKKIYFKRVSSSMLKWQSFSEDMQMAEELGLMKTMEMPRKRIGSFDFSENEVVDEFGFSNEADSVVLSSETSFF